MNFITEKLLYRMNVNANSEKFLTAKESFSINDFKLSLYEWQNPNYHIGSGMQTWQFQYNEGRVAYKIMCLEYSTLNHASEGKVISYIENNEIYNLALSLDEDKDEQYWLPIQVEGENYLLVNYKDNSLVITLKDANDLNEHSQFVLEKLSDLDSLNRDYQEFTIDSIEAFSKQERNIENGLFQIRTLLAENMVLDKPAHSSNIILFENHGGNNQKWNFIYSTDKKAYQITSMANTNLALAWDEENNNACVTSNLDLDNAFWAIKKCGENEYILKNKKNKNMLLSVENDETTNSTNIFVESSRNAERQKFELIRII